MTENNSAGVRSAALALFAALIWGTAFVAQKVSTTGAFIFNAARSLVAFLFLLLVLLVMKRGDVHHLFREDKGRRTKDLWIGAVLSGVSLALATFFQQEGMNLGTEAGKAGFLTALYIVLVPVIGLFFREKIGLKVWIAIGVAVVGLYLLSVRGGFTMRRSDLFVIMAGLLFAIQIRAVDRYSPLCDSVRMSCIQFLVSFVVSGIGALIFEPVRQMNLQADIWSILYLGILSSGVAYTLQILAQRNGNPAVVSVLMSMEAVFSVLAGAIFLKEVLTSREYLGCGIMLIAVILTQVPDALFKKINTHRTAKE